MNAGDSSGRIVPLLDDAGIADLLRTSRRIAVVSASSNVARPSNGVFRALVPAGYTCVPVNPNETEVEGVAAVSTLAEAVTVGARALWLQLGVINLESARIAAAGGLAVVMNRCTAIEIRRIGQR